MNIERDYFFT